MARGTRMLVFPASGRIFQEALEHGYVADLIANLAMLDPILGGIDR